MSLPAPTATVSRPDFLRAHPPAQALHQALLDALHGTPLAPHAHTLALRAVLHAAAWLDADPVLHPYAARLEGGQIVYRYGCGGGVPAGRLHGRALLDGPLLTRTGLAVCLALQPGAAPGQVSAATSGWLQLLRLYARYGLDFEAQAQVG